MHQNNSAAATAAAAAASTQENGRSHPDADSEKREPEGDTERLRNPFADDEDDEEIDSDDGNDDDQVATEAGPGDGGMGRGGWWRGMMGRRSNNKFEGGSDSDEDDDDDDDEEFGDFAMPEVESAPPLMGSRDGDKGIIKPTPVHPPSMTTSSATTEAGTTTTGGGPNQKSALGSLWPFTTQGFGSSGGVKEGSSGEKHETSGIARAVEATRRTSIEDPDEEEVVV
jgi:SIT4-associating protein SAP185/190